MPSADFVRNAQCAVGCEYFMRISRPDALRLSALFKSLYPAFHEKYRKAFEAGVWVRADPGPFLGRAIVWKLQVEPHRDGLDAGPAICFPLGSFTGGALYLPDLGLKLTCEALCFCSLNPSNHLLFADTSRGTSSYSWRATYIMQ